MSATCTRLPLVRSVAAKPSESGPSTRYLPSSSAPSNGLVIARYVEVAHVGRGATRITVSGANFRFCRLVELRETFAFALVEVGPAPHRLRHEQARGVLGDSGAVDPAPRVWRRLRARTATEFGPRTVLARLRRVGRPSRRSAPRPTRQGRSRRSDRPWGSSRRGATRYVVGELALTSRGRRPSE